MRRNKKAVYTVEVPVTFKFTASNDLDEDELLTEMERVLKRAIKNKEYTFLNNRASVVDKKTILSLAEKLEQEKIWNELFGG